MLKSSLIYFVFILLQLLVEANCQKGSTQFLVKLSQDLIKQLENSNNCDVIINVDKGDNRIEFCAHSFILETRSTYFKGALLSNGMAKEENNHFFTLDFPDISVNVFNILIR